MPTRPEAAPQYAQDGRRIMDPPCELGHTRQAQECPACGERVTGQTAKPEHWKWYAGRTSSKTAAARARVVADERVARG